MPMMKQFPIIQGQLFNYYELFDVSVITWMFRPAAALVDSFNVFTTDETANMARGRDIVNINATPTSSEIQNSRYT